MKNYKFAVSILKKHFADIKYGNPFGIIQSAEQLLKSKQGHCWDPTELARHLFNKEGIPCRTFFMDRAINNSRITKTHTFLVFESDGAVYWFENAWESHRGVHRYNSLQELLADVPRKMKEDEKSKGNSVGKIRLREYDAPKLPLHHMEYFYHCLNGNPISITSKLPRPAISRRGSR